MSELWKILQENMGISWRGFLVVMLAMLPNIFYGIMSKTNVPENPVEPNEMVSMIENASRGLFIIFLIVIWNKDKLDNRPIYFIGMAVCLLVYYALWARYFVHGRDVEYLEKNLWIIPVPMAIFPCLYFAFGAFWLHNIPDLVVLAVFSVCHCILR
ncbi:hypothetical protein [Anaerosporobacter faecicola]|uniref:hypothetical protein n=1 Tax=Anaerosporobacter faecicola TaxID=2718714 RepID=UPI001439B59C|nr:hypothetical protein [Anaerosporobacter faecicola]